jgi:hypothetical protein
VAARDSTWSLDALIGGPILVLGDDTEEMDRKPDDTFVQRPRIAEIREAMINEIPCRPSVEKAARAELRSLSFRSLLAQYLNWAHRSDCEASCRVSSWFLGLFRCSHPRRQHS